MSDRNDGRFRLTSGRPEDFDHAAHVKAAHALLQRLPFLEAATLYAARLRELAADAGQPTKFNTTITVAYLSLIAERLADNPCLDWRLFIARNEDLLNRRLLMHWYDRDRLWSDAARNSFLMPNAAR